jgi:hypothetical protein
MIAPGPLAARSDAVTVWTGEEMLVWGGSQGDEWHTDGAGYDPSGDTWRALPPAPAGVAGVSPTGVWTDDELVVFTEVDDAGGIAYQPAAGDWRAIAAAPGDRAWVPGSSSAASWTGAEVAVLASGSRRTTDNVAAYRPGSDRWYPLPDPPPTFRRLRPAVWTGRHLVVWGGFGGPATEPYPAVAFNPRACRWERVAPPGGRDRTLPSLTWTGERVLAWGGWDGVTAYADGAATGDLDASAGAGNDAKDANRPPLVGSVLGSCYGP